MCKKTCLGCLLSEGISFLFSNHDLGLALYSSWPCGIWVEILGLGQSALLTDGFSECSRGDTAPSVCSVWQRVASLSGPLSRLDKGGLFCPQIGQSIEEFLFPSHLRNATFPLLPPCLQKIQHFPNRNQHEKLSLSHCHSGIIDEYASLVACGPGAALVALRQAPHDYAGR